MCFHVFTLPRSARADVLSNRADDPCRGLGASRLRGAGVVTNAAIAAADIRRLCPLDADTLAAPTSKSASHW